MRSAVADRVAGPRAIRRPLVCLFAAESFCGAALVFMVQSMVAKIILPAARRV
jgi:hypothetical protein